MISKNQAESPSIFISTSPAKLPVRSVRRTGSTNSALRASQPDAAAVNSTAAELTGKKNLLGSVKMKNNAKKLNRTDPFNNVESPKISKVLYDVVVPAK